MPKFYAIHYTDDGKLPELNPLQRITLKRGIEKALARNPDVKYNGTMFDPNTGIGVCDWDAPAASDVKSILENVGAPYDVVIPVEPLKL